MAVRRQVDLSAYAMLRQMASDLGIGEAARALGVSADTLRRWDRSGKLRTTRDERNRRRVPAAEIERLRGAPRRHRTGDSFSARNRFPGTVRSVETDGVMALVEIEAGAVPGSAANTPPPGGGPRPPAGPPPAPAREAPPGLVAAGPGGEG